MKEFHKELLKSILILLFFAGVAFLIFSLTSCTTTKYIPITKVKTDTLYKARKDSLRFISLFSVKDSTRMHDSTVISYNSKGGITKYEIWHWRERYRTEKDSTNYFKNVIDSLLSKKQSDIEKPVQVTKTVVEKYSVTKKARIAIIFFAAGFLIGFFRKQIWKVIIFAVSKIPKGGI